MQTLFGPPADTLQILLDDPQEHDFADMRRIIGGLSAQQALTKLEGWPYSIAELLAHLNANMQFNLELIRSTDPAGVPKPDLWPQVENWQRLVEVFLQGMAELVQIAKRDNLEHVLFPATDTEPGWTVGYKLALSVAKHNAYHLGQIALLHKLLP